jgi:hypothetical protein
MAAQLIWTVLIVAALVLFLAYLLFQQRRTTVAVIPQLQGPLADLTASLVQISKDLPALKAAADGAISAQDIADTAAALQGAADQAKVLAAAVAPQSVSPPVIS